jgi:hypothetical protein
MRKKHFERSYDFEIWGSYRDDYEDYCIIQCEQVSTNISEEQVAFILKAEPNVSTYLPEHKESHPRQGQYSQSHYKRTSHSTR